MSGMASGLLPRVVDAVERVTARAADADELLEGVATEIGKAVPYDGAMWFGLDPTTLLAVSPARMEHLDDGYCNTFWFGEFHEQDANLFADLARGDASAATLRSATDDRPMRSARYRDFLQPQGYDDELRVVFRTAGKSWGVGGLFREPGRAPFDAERRRRAGSRLADRGGGVPHPCGADGAHARVHARTGADAVQPRRRHHLGQRRGVALAGRDLRRGPRHQLVRDPRRARAAPTSTPPSRSSRSSPGPTPSPRAATPDEARLRLRDRSGRWLVLHASVLDSASGDGNVAIVVEPAKSGDLAPIIIEAYGLTLRERDVVRAIARGSSTPDIAAELFLSAHTVRDYIKAVFDKVGVSSRGELVAKLFAEHYADPFHETLVEVH